MGNLQMKYAVLFALCLTLAGCGGGSSDSGSNTGGSAGTPPTTGNSSLCNGTDTNSKIGCEMFRNYLWYNEMRSAVPSSFSSASSYLNAILAPRDSFSFILTEQEYQSRFIDAVFFGYGFATQRVDNNTALQILYVYDGSSAAQQGLRRADKITEIEGVSVAEWLAGLDSGRLTNDDIYGPNQAGVIRNFVWRKPDNSMRRADLQKGSVTTNTVMHRSVAEVAGKKVGYLVFNQFIDLSERELEQAFQFFAVQQIDELVLDLRYNGGGLIRVANQLSSHIAFNRLRDRVFVKYRYNDKNSSRNSTVLFAPGQGQTLLNLPRVFVLTTPGSCSSSELVINAMSPFVEVVQIGQTTCGKPIGQIPTLIDNFRLFAINFQTVNALDFGDYFNGLQPQCPVTPAVVGDWGASNDPLYATAINYINSGRCASGQALSVAEQTLQGDRQFPEFADARNQPSWRIYNEQ